MTRRADEVVALYAHASASELRATLCDEIKKLREGETTPARLNAVSNVAGKRLATVRARMRSYRLVGGIDRARKGGIE